MLARVSGGSAGIREYLERGHKQGREYTRDELDQRVPLHGDLAMTDSVIESMTGEGEKYTHVTLSFREDYIPTETLQAITDDFKDFAFSAYDSDEFNMYAEAHLPKIRSYEHARTGELIQRKPHIHIVVPEKNLLTGKHLNPFGKVDQQTAYLEAFQEHVNAKYGLASPKDHMRGDLTPDSEMISRYKGDMFEGGAKAKAQILDAMLARGIENMDDFRGMLGELGEHRTRNAGKPNAYEHVKVAGEARGLNLREQVFRREFVELPMAAKRAMLAKDAAAHYETTKAARPSPADIEQRLAEWHDIRAPQLKYINSGNRKLWKEYSGADTDRKREILADRRARFYQRHRKEQSLEHPDRQRRVADLEHDLRAADRHIRAARRVDRNPERARQRVADRRLIRAVATALERPGRDQAPARDRGTGAPQPGDVTNRYAREMQERRQGRALDARGDMDTIKRNLDGRRLLAHVSHTHGVVADKYQVTKGRDGSDRIRCGNRNLNVTDFLTKELNLPYREAAPLLRDAYAQQTRGTHIERRERPRERLWKEYSQAWRPALTRQHQERRQAIQNERREALAKHRDESRKKLDALRAQRSLTAKERAVARSIVKMEKVQADALARAKAATELEALASERKAPAEQYRTFLQERANGGDLDALAELRRQRSGYDQEREGNAATAGDEKATAREPSLAYTRLSYQVDRRGHVTYSDVAGRALLRDEGRRVSMLNVDRATVETGLRLAKEKFGNKLSIEGTDAFKRTVVELTVQKNIGVTFNDPAMEKMRREVERDLAAGRQAIHEQRAEQRLARESVVTFRGLEEHHYEGRFTPTDLQVRGQRAMVEKLNSLHLVRRDETATVEALKVAKQKFGGTVQVDGTDADKRKVAELAVKHGVDVKFTDKALNKHMHNLKEQQRTPGRDRSLPSPGKSRSRDHDLGR